MDSKQFICRCGRLFKYKKNFTRHKNNDCASYKKFACTAPGCLFKFKQKVQLKAHTLNKHGRNSENNDDRLFCCDVCFRSYKARRSLWRHKKFECQRQPMFACPMDNCGYRGKQKVTVFKHILNRHNTPKNYDFL